jgi:polyisoprenyl-phosphate glycosyltransferase
MSPKLLLIVPCYNEEEIISLTFDQLNTLFSDLILQNKIDKGSKFCFVNDGSKDKTWAIIESLYSKSEHLIALKFSKNFGHQNAVLAGHIHYKDNFDIFISIDADLQDDINCIAEMVNKYKEGNEIVYGVRDDRTDDSFFKRFTAEFFYKIMNKMDIPLVFNHADFRLLSKKAVAELVSFGEYKVFLRGVVPSLGFKSEKVYYKRLSRVAGETKYPLKKMISFAWNGITSFSIYPMRLVLWFGFLNFIAACGIGIYVLRSMFLGNTVAGWVSIVLPMAYFSGATLLAIGLLGEYIGKIYEEVKGRPRYIIEKTLGE